MPRKDVGVKLPDYVKHAMSALESSGYETYVVGGAVRDLALSRKPSDFDLCTSATPDKIAEIFSGNTLDLTGAEYGTVRVHMSERVVEITTMRADGSYSDGRHPDEVRFCTDIEADLKRRDFTVNAMACKKNGQLVDPFNGQSDIADKLVRTVLDPDKSFSDDALRILRLVRLCATLSFKAQGETFDAALRQKAGIRSLAPERIRDELSRLVMCDGAGSVIYKFREIIFEFIPEFRACEGFDQHNPNHSYDVLEHICKTVDLSERELSVRLAALLHDIGKPECFTISESGRGRFIGHMEVSARMAREILTRLRYPSKIVETVCVLVENHDKPHEASAVSARRWLNRIGSKNVFLILKLKHADCLAHAPSYHNRLGRLAGFRREVKNALARRDCYSLSALAVTGRDVNRTLGLTPSEETGEVLRWLLEQVIEGTMPNERAALLTAAKQYEKPKGNGQK